MLCERARPADPRPQVSSARRGLASDLDRVEPRAAPVDSAPHGGLDCLYEWPERIEHRLVAAAGTAEYVPTSGGPLVGMLPGLQFTTHTYLLRPADTLIVYTDGLTDARIDDANGRYSHEALLEFAASIAPASATAAVASLAGLLAGFGAGLDDDAAVMALTVTP